MELASLEEFSCSFQWRESDFVQTHDHKSGSTLFICEMQTILYQPRSSDCKMENMLIWKYKRGRPCVYYYYAFWSCDCAKGFEIIPNPYSVKTFIMWYQLFHPYSRVCMIPHPPRTFTDLIFLIKLIQDVLSETGFPSVLQSSLLAKLVNCSVRVSEAFPAFICFLYEWHWCYFSMLLPPSG